ncbi:MAG TPA: M14 family zinc carboxypeptidase [Flavobacteriaceae bacterium]
MTITLLNKFHKTCKETSLFHRYITLQHISSLLKKLEHHFDIRIIGQSVLGLSIHAIKIGTGNHKILMWSQMHGNESTTTKAVFDLCNLFAENDHDKVRNILKSCTIAIIPMLNPDGAKAYTRLNAKGVDLNRDAQKLSQPESKILRSFFNDFKPDFCFNLHGQRTIFSAGSNNLPATISFLAPAQDERCTITENRTKAMEIISAMNVILQGQIPNQVGIYDDAFNINCVGDTFQTQNVPTILVEAGHYTNDYPREETRRLVFQSLLTALNYIATTKITGDSYKPYFDIPENEKLFYDIIIRNASVNSQIQDIGIMYQEKLIKNKVEFIPVVEKISNLKSFYAHRKINANKNEVFADDLKPLNEGVEIDFVLIKNERISLIL